jgi:hypothetical protein
MSGMERNVLAGVVGLSIVGASLGIAGETGRPEMKASVSASPMADEPAPKHVKLLVIGNSFSGNATRHLPRIAEAGGDKLTLRAISLSGCPLERHWKNAEAFQQGATNSEARAWMALTAEDWDFITLQQYKKDTPRQ